MTVIKHDRPKCCSRVFTGYSFRGVPCSRYGKVERDGKWYCGQHDPVTRREKRDKNVKKWQTEYEAQANRDREIQAELTYQRAAAVYCRALGVTLDDMTPKPAQESS